MGKPRDAVTSKQVTVAIFSMVMGAGILAVSREVTDTVQTPDAWISILLGGILAMIGGALTVILCRRYPGKTIFQFSTEVVGTAVGKVLNILASLYFIVVAGFETRILAELVSTYLLQTTPDKVMMIVFIWVGVYLAVGGINPILKAFEMYFPIVIVLLVGILLLSMKKFDINNMRPFFGKGILPVVRGVGNSFMVYAGYEIVMVIIAVMEEPQKAMKSMLLGLLITVIVNTAVVVITIGVLTVDEINNLTWPTSSLVAEIDFPGGFIENFKLFFVIIWIICIYTSFVGALYIAGLGLSQTLNVKYSNALYAILPFVYVTALIPHDLAEIFDMGDMIGYTWLLIGLAFPMIFLLISFLKERKNKKKKKRSKQK